MSHRAEPLLAVVGPTASGKGAFARHPAPRLDAEILSLDSMKVFRGLDIGTAKPSTAARAETRWHLIDLAEPHEEFSTRRWLDAAETAITDITSRGRRALFAGGTALYLQALRRGLFDGPSADWALRERLAADGAPALAARLRRVDPVAADRIDPNDLRRLVRALEVFELTGRPISDLQREWEVGPDRHSLVVAGLRRDREDLHARIDRRVERMFDDGLVDEVRALLAAGVTFGRTASQALGYREVLAHLAPGGPDLDETIALVQRHTRQFAKRQRTWFRKMKLIQWIDVSAGEPVEDVARCFWEVRGGTGPGPEAP